MTLMLGPLTHDTLDDYLAAFADGELDAAQTLAMWAFLETHAGRAAALRRVQELQQLSAAARRNLATAAPRDLHDRIATLVAAEQPAASARDGVDPAMSIRFRLRTTTYAFAVAAGLLIGVISTASLLRSTSPRAVLPAELVVNVGRVHAECSRLPEAMHNASFESVDAKLASTLQVSLKSATAAPDLLAAGFRFVGAGPCHGAGPETVHLLYRSANAQSISAISLFVQPDDGQYPSLEADHVYRVSSPASPFPTLAWRKDHVVCVLLADSDETESTVLQMIRPTPADEIIVVASR